MSEIDNSTVLIRRPILYKQYLTEKYRMRSLVKGVAWLILIAIILLIIWCVVLKKCGKGPLFGMIPPFPTIGRKQNGNGGGNGKLNVSGSGSGGAGAGGEGKASLELTPTGGTKNEKGENCGFLGIGCWPQVIGTWLNQAAKNIGEGKTIFGQETIELGRGSGRGFVPRVIVP